MNVEIVADKMPLSRFWLGYDSVLNVSPKILLVAGLTGSTTPVGNKRATNAHLINF